MVRMVQTGQMADPELLAPPERVNVFWGNRRCRTGAPYNATVQNPNCPHSTFWFYTPSGREAWRKASHCMGRYCRKKEVHGLLQQCTACNPDAPQQACHCATCCRRQPGYGLPDDRRCRQCPWGQRRHTQRTRRRPHVPGPGQVGARANSSSAFVLLWVLGANGYRWWAHERLVAGCVRVWRWCLYTTSTAKYGSSYV